MNFCSKEEVFRILENMCHVIRSNEKYLNDLDSVIGDAEHGSNLKKAMEESLQKIKTLTCDSPFELIRIFGATMASSGCGSGPLLYGLAIRAFGRSLAEAGSFDPMNVARGLREALNTVKTRGGSEVGDKTMVDALEPAVQAFEEAVHQGKSLVEAFAKAVEAAEEGMLLTSTLVGKKGRGSYLGERGVGHQDPGATSMYLLLASVYQTLAGKEL